ncbi:MAG: hypothetical protein ACYC1I_12945 [Acidimicrobiales bacterium]
MMIVAAFACVLITVALGDDYWQADLIGSLGGLTYLFGMVIYGVRDTKEANFQSDNMASSVASGPKRDSIDSAHE